MVPHFAQNGSDTMVLTIILPLILKYNPPPLDMQCACDNALSPNGQPDNPFALAPFILYLTAYAFACDRRNCACLRIFLADEPLAFTAECHCTGSRRPSIMASPVKMAKSVLRKQVKSEVSRLSMEERARQSRVVTQRLLALPQYQQSQRVSIYLNMPDEIQTGDIVADLLQAGKQCFIPRYESSSSRMDMVRLHSLADLASLPTTKWNIQQPAMSEEREEALQTGGLDLILMPGLAFSRSGHRLGRGRGYYDRYLVRCREAQQRPPVTVALVFREQIVEDVPVEGTDVPVDVVLCEDGQGDC